MVGGRAGAVGVSMPTEGRARACSAARSGVDGRAAPLVRAWRSASRSGVPEAPHLARRDLPRQVGAATRRSPGRPGPPHGRRVEAA